MNRPYTGPMQFPGELQPGLYVDPYEAVRLADQLDLARKMAGLTLDQRQIVALQACARLLRSHSGIAPPQRAHLEE